MFDETSPEKTTDIAEKDLFVHEESVDLPTVLPGETAVQASKYVDENGDIAIIPKDFIVSEKEGEHTVNTGVKSKKKFRSQESARVPTQIAFHLPPGTA